MKPILIEMNILTVDVESDFPPYLNTNKGIKGIEYIVSQLKEHGCSATFFVTANYLSENPEIKQILTGYEIGCHGYDHVDYTTLTRSEIEEHFKKAKDVYKLMGVKITGFRAPYAAYNETVLETASKNFMYDSSKPFWLHEKYEVQEFPIFTGGKMFGMPSIFFNKLFSVPIRDKVFFIHPWEFGGVDFKKISEKRKKLKLLGYSEKNYKKNLNTLLSKKCFGIQTAINSY